MASPIGEVNLQQLHVTSHGCKRGAAIEGSLERTLLGILKHRKTLWNMMKNEESSSWIIVRFTNHVFSAFELLMEAEQALFMRISIISWRASFHAEYVF